MEISSSSQRILSSLLEARTGQQLTFSRRWRIDSALSSIMRERGFESIDQLVARVVSGRDPALAEHVIEALLNNEPYVCRDRLPFEMLISGAVRRFEKTRAREKRLAIWCAGCSTGQEVYSLAMSFAETKLRWQDWKIDILGTDVSRSAVERARQGLYSQFEVQRGLPVMQMMRWFDEVGAQQWQIRTELQKAVRFQVHSLLEAPPQPRRFDIILCRNVLLYFAGDTQKAVFRRLAEASAPDACLMLGAGETVIGHTDDFVSDPEQRGLYVRKPVQAPPARAALG